MMASPHSLRYRLFLLFQGGFGFMIAAGSTFEVVNLLVPSLFPDLQNDPLMRLHHLNRVVKWWTLCSNVVAAGCGAALAAGALGAWKEKGWSGRVARCAASIMILIAVGGAFVSGAYLVPPLLLGLHSISPSERAMAAIFLSSIVGSVFFVGLAAAFILFVYRRKGMASMEGNRFELWEPPPA
jgi:hypothetical protein